MIIYIERTRSEGAGTTSIHKKGLLGITMNYFELLEAPRRHYCELIRITMNYQGLPQSPRMGRSVWCILCTTAEGEIRREASGSVGSFQNLEIVRRLRALVVSVPADFLLGFLSRKRAKPSFSLDYFLFWGEVGITWVGKATLRKASTPTEGKEHLHLAISRDPQYFQSIFLVFPQSSMCLVFLNTILLES